jgi:hypothetical protein
VFILPARRRSAATTTTTIHTCELNGADPFDYLNQLQRHAEELKQSAVGLDALELPRDAGADRRTLGCGIGYAEPCMAEKDRRRLGGTALIKRP